MRRASAASTWIPGPGCSRRRARRATIVVKLNTELRKVIDNPETKAKIATLGFEAFSSSPEELDQHVKVQLEKWTKMIKDAGIQPE